MTGYGAASLETPSLRATVTARSLNHRFLDLTLHLPRRLQPFEAEAKERVVAAVARGRVEVSIQASLPDGAADAVVASRPLVVSLVRALRDLQSEFGLEGGVSVADLVRFPGALDRVEVPAAVSGEVRTALAALLERALEGLDAMRRAEGERLSAELERSLLAIEAAAGAIERLSTESREARRAALAERLRSLLSELGLDEVRLYQEAARAVERHDVAEEIQRLRSHVASVRELLAAGGAPAGKRLDFLAQELMREANTIGSKIADAAAIRQVVELKAEIERLREQVQNVE
jgi:uncharacterized protein (TIGR00255 family)